MAEPSVFHFPIEAPIANDRVKLVPFDLDLHGAAFIAQSADHPELYANISFIPFSTVNDMKAAFTKPDTILSLSNPAHTTLAIIDKTRDRSPEDPDGELAGMVAYINTSKAHLSSEVGAIIVLPRYQRSHVTSNTVGLMMQHGFARPEQGGMGLQRMQWHCSTANAASARVAERMGFEKVGVIPYHMKFPLGRRYGKQGNGKPLPPGSHPDDVWRDTFYYSMSWDVWESEAREKVEKVMSR
ncbi:gnat family [Diaporthe amygdali]|uniref:gnat family n=1 Tax=Phomopsis amygdali TaxID=1214568 RepID=UPI0022FF3472|nr:gnat family [Diaporthe amygdali]KAJ0114170.1 gnat family [Diaporthe amygdali]